MTIRLSHDDWRRLTEALDSEEPVPELLELLDLLPNDRRADPCP